VDWGFVPVAWARRCVYEPAAIPATLEELVVQIIMAVAGIGVFYARRKLQTMKN